MSLPIGAPTEQELASVVALADAHRKWLGFLPASVIRELARAGRCLVARDGSGVTGYVLFDLPGNDVRITQLCVDPESRRTGVAESLVSALSHAHPERRGLRLSCRSDWPASKVWPKLGFRPVSTRPGRGKSQQTLTVWFRGHENPDLFSSTEEPRIRVVLDTDVFSRIFGADSREDSEALVLAPASPLMRDGISLVQTRALAVELNETGDPGLRRRLLGSLSALEVLRGELASVAAAQAELLDRVPNNVLDADPTLIRDAHNIAFAKVGGATCFVTMDRSALRHLAPLALELWNFPVRRPVQALIDEFADQDNSRYLPMGLASTDFGIRELTGDSALSGFVAHASGERERAWEGSFAAALASSMTTGGLRKLVLDPTGDPVAVLITDSQHSRVIVQVFRVSSRHQLALSIARQLASLLRIEAVAIGADRIEVTDRHAGPIVQDGLLQEGFKRSELGLYFCDVTDDVVSVGDPRIPSSGGANPPDFAALEHDAWPVKIRGGGIPSIVIPIRPAFADALLGRETLVARRPLIGLSRENVYYRAPTRSVPSPSRVLWYASRPVSAVVACSRVIHVESGPVDLIHSTRAHLGVWKRRDIELAAKDGQVQAVHFTDTESLFPVNFERLAPLAPSDSLGTIRTVTSISEEGFLSIYQAGRGRR